MLLKLLLYTYGLFGCSVFTALSVLYASPLCLFSFLLAVLCAIGAVSTWEEMNGD